MRVPARQWRAHQHALRAVRGRRAMSAYRAAIIVVCAGLLTFGVVYTLLEVSRSSAAPNEVVIVATPTLAALARPTDAVFVDGGQRVVAVPIAGSESLLRGVQ